MYQHKDHLGNIRLSYADIDGSETIDSASEILEENNYYPFGLKHQGYNEIANSNRSEAAEKYKYGGKEWNDELGLDLYDFHARNYDPAIGRWLNVDPSAEKYPDWTPYHYVHNNPIIHIDPDGRDAIIVVFPKYMVDTENRFLGKQPLGHAGILLIDNETGLTKYYEYGRYSTEDGTKGRVRNVTVSNVIIDPETGKPTQESLNKVLGQISEKSGQGGDIQGAYIEGDFNIMNDYAQGKLKESNPEYKKEYNKDRKPYKLLSNNCGTFADDVIKLGVTTGTTLTDRVATGIENSVK